MKEDEIRNRSVFNEYLKLSAQDSKVYFRNKEDFESTSQCLACGSSHIAKTFEKNGFQYYECSECDTLFVNPRPAISMLEEFYSNSPSTTFWVEKFFKPVAEARRIKIFKPRAEYIAEFLGDGQKVIGDIGAGFGLFLEEIRKILPDNNYFVIEPSVDMAQICRGKGFQVIESVLENIPAAEHQFDVLLAFELFEHLQNPETFLRKVYDLLNDHGLFIFTTLNGLGFDIQLLWEKSKSISPPHHLNFFNPWSAKILAERIGFTVMEYSTPGKLDWDIIEGGINNEDQNPGRLWRNFAKYANNSSKEELQKWIRSSNFSSHMRIILKK